MNALQIAIEFYILQYFCGTVFTIIDHIRDEANPRRTTIQKGFIVIIAISHVIEVIRIQVMQPIKELNLTSWQISCPHWVIVIRIVFNSLNQMHPFVMVMSYDLLIFYFVKKQDNNGNAEEYLTTEDSTKSYSLLIRDSKDDYRRLELNKSLSDSLPAMNTHLQALDA